MQKVSPLQAGPPLPGRTVQHNSEQRIWVIDQQIMRCSPIQYDCFRLLAEHPDRLVRFSQFEQQVPNLLSNKQRARLLARAQLRYVLVHLRAKCWSLGLNIVNVRGQGYVLVSQRGKNA